MALIVAGSAPVGPDSPTPLAPIRVGGGGNARARHREGAQIVGAGQGVVHERAGQELPALRIDPDLFQQRLADALGDAAVQLAGIEHRVDHPPGVRNSGVAHDLDDARVGIDLHLADLRGARPVPVFRGEPGLRAEPGLETGRQGRRLHRGMRDVGERHRPVGSCHREAGIGIGDVGLGRFEQVGGDALALVDHLVGGEADRRPGDRRRARIERPPAVDHEIGIALDEADIARRDAEAFAQDLPEDRRVALAVVDRSGHQREPARGVDADFRRLDDGSRGLLDGIGEAEPAQPAARFRLMPAFRKPFYISLLKSTFLRFFGKSPQS